MRATVELRPVEDGHIETFFHQQAEPEGAAMAAFPARGRQAHFAHWAKLRADPNVRVMTILANGEVAGNIGSWFDGEVWQVGYWLGKAFWGMGVATEALGAFARSDPHRPLHAHVAERNVGSIRVLEKCGFAKAGEQKGVALHGGEPVDEFVFVLER